MDPSVTCAYQQPKLCAVPCSLFRPSTLPPTPRLIAHELGYCLTRKAAAPDKETVAEELVQDMQELGHWADVCADLKASRAEVERAAAALVNEIGETKELKLRNKP